MIDTNTSQITAARLRERAANCRAMARRALSSGVAAELVSIAEDYDRDAVRLETLPDLASRPSAVL